MFCICLNDNLIDRVKRLKYIPVGVGPEKFSTEWLLDTTGENISNKNKFYGEYTAFLLKDFYHTGFKRIQNI